MTKTQVRELSPRKVMVGFALSLIIMFLASSGADAAPLPNEMIEAKLQAYSTAVSADTPFTKTEIGKSYVIRIVERNLDKRLIRDLQDGQGMNYAMPAGSNHEGGQVAVLTLAFPNERSTQKNAAIVGKIGTYFRHTKILTRFSYAVLGSTLFIVFYRNGRKPIRCGLGGRISSDG